MNFDSIQPRFQVRISRSRIPLSCQLGFRSRETNLCIAFIASRLIGLQALATPRGGQTVYCTD
jgi:hypothetical protein